MRPCATVKKHDLGHKTYYPNITVALDGKKGGRSGSVINIMPTSERCGNECADVNSDNEQYYS